MKRSNLANAVVIGLGLAMGSGMALAGTVDDHNVTIGVQPFERLDVMGNPLLMLASEYDQNVITGSDSTSYLSYVSNLEDRKISVLAEMADHDTQNYDLTILAHPVKIFGVAEGTASVVNLVDDTNADLIVDINRVKASAALEFTASGTIEDGTDGDSWDLTYTLTAM